MVRGRDRELAPLVELIGDLLQLGLDGCDAVGAQLQPGGRSATVAIVMIAAAP